jgi:hypothetical protein
MLATARRRARCPTPTVAARETVEQPRRTALGYRCHGYILIRGCYAACWSVWWRPVLAPLAIRGWILALALRDCQNCAADTEGGDPSPVGPPGRMVARPLPLPRTVLAGLPRRARRAEAQPAGGRAASGEEGAAP